MTVFSQRGSAVVIFTSRLVFLQYILVYVVIGSALGYLCNNPCFEPEDLRHFIPR